VNVDLRPVAGTPDLFEGWGHGQLIGSALLIMVGTTARIVARLENAPTDVADITGFLMAVVARAQAAGAGVLEFEGDSLVLRHEARRAGFRGGLRLPLRASVDDLSWAAPGRGPGLRAQRQERMTWLIATLADVGVTATAAPAPRALGRVAKRLNGGVGDTLEVIIEWSPGRTFIISTPDRVDIMPEAVALTASTTIAVLHRFPDEALVVKFIYFDQSIAEMKAGTVAGMTEQTAPTIHMNVAYVVVEFALDLLAKRTPSTVAQHPTGIPLPFKALDGTVAHEIWHKVESVFEARQYRSSIEFRRQLGLFLDVDTLEQAVKGGSPGAPEAWQAAFRRVSTEVSAYATTNAHEATAEMFKLWWQRDGMVSPLVARFGELIDHFLPRPDRPAF
jgi:hypothetical protein